MSFSITHYDHFHCIIIVISENSIIFCQLSIYKDVLGFLTWIGIGGIGVGFGIGFEIGVASI